MRHIVSLASILLAITGALAQDKLDSAAPSKVSGEVQQKSLADHLKDTRESAAAITATALELQNKNKKLEAENAKLKASVRNSTTEQFRWKRRNVDPCKPNPKCTIEFVLSKSGWSPEEQAAMLKIIKTTHPKRVMIKKGDTFDFMAFGKRPGTERVIFNVLADWDDTTHEEPALLWELTLGTHHLDFLSPFICSNYSGRRRKIQPALIEQVEVKRSPVATVTLPDPMPLGVNPGNFVVCPDD